MLRDAEDGKFSHIGLYKADRFGRDTLEGLQTAKKLIDLGIKIRIAYNASWCDEYKKGSIVETIICVVFVFFIFVGIFLLCDLIPL